MLPSPRALLETAGVPALWVSDLLNIQYITGLTLSAGCVLVTARQYTLFVDDRYLEGAMRSVRDGVHVRPLAEAERVLKKNPICGFEEEHVTLAQLRSWKTKFDDTKWVRTNGVIEQYRREKDETELRLIKRAHRITQEMLRRVPAALRSGITERGLAWKLETWAHELGADGLAFPAIVAFGSHTSRPHHTPTTRALHKGHIVQIDVGAKVKGYCADRSDVYFTADPTPAEANALRAVKEALTAVLDAVKPGVTNHQLDALARETMAKYGIAEEHILPHALGHGVGLDVHEGIILSSRRAKEAVLKHEVLAIEPAIYIPGKFGIRLEEMVVVS